MPDVLSIEQLERENRILRAKVKHLENELVLLKSETTKTKTDFLDVFFNKKEIIEERTQALSASEKRFRQMAEAINEVYWMASADFSKFLFASPSFSCLWRTPVENLYGDPGLWLEHIHPDDQDLVRSNRKMLSHGAPTFEEFRLMDGHGSWRWIANASYPIRDESGAVESITGIARDITHKHRNDEILLNSKQEWESTFDSIPDCICILDTTFVITRMNTSMAARLGGHPRDFVGRPCASVLCETNQTDCCHILRQAHESPDPQELPLKHLEEKLGGTFLVTATPLTGRSKELGRTVLVFRDVTQRRIAEARYRDLFQHASSGIFRASHSGEFLSVNPALATMLGYADTKECLRDCPALQDLFLDPGLPSEIRGQLNQNGEILGLETKLRRSDGESIWVRINARVSDKDREQECCEGFMEDITERKRAEQSLAQSQRLEAMGILAGGIAHDFNNILGAIIGYTDLALAETIPDEQRNANLKQVIAAGRRARDLVKQILTFSRSSPQQAGPVDLIPIIKETLSFLRSSFPTSIHIEHDLPQNPRHVALAPTKLHQVIMNLCTNAAQAMQTTGGALRVELFDTPASVAKTLTIPDTTIPLVCLRISDTGIGIHKRVLERIFEPYFTTKKVGEGTGMGLAVVHGIVRGGGGEIRVDSFPGQGTRFSVHLPRVQAMESSLKPETSPHEEQGRGERILVVDDEKELVAMLKQMLSSLGYQPLGAHSSTLALQLFQADPDMFDLVLTDQTMPQMTGIDLARAFAEIRPEVPVLICTGHGGDFAASDRPPNIRRILEKPLEKGPLSTILRQCLDAAATAAETQGEDRA